MIEEILEAEEIPFVVCPLCGLHRKLKKNGRWAIIRKKMGDIRSRALKYNPEKETRFDIVNIQDEPFISIRLRALGRGGLPEVRALTLKEAIEDPEYREDTIELLRQIKSKIEELLPQIDRILEEYK